MNSDGSNPTRLVDDPSGGRSSSLLHCDRSPDTTKITYTYHPDSRGGEWPDDVYVMNADGSGKINLTSTPAREFHPRWSPDGTKFIFSKMHFLKFVKARFNIAQVRYGRGLGGTKDDLVA
jgi:Tol biopolymer transport system component